MSFALEIYKNNEDFREAIKTLRTNILFAGIDRPIHSISITSSNKREGKSLISCCLGIAMTEIGKNTLIIENDFRNPRVRYNLMTRGKNTYPDILSIGDIDDIRKICIQTEIPRLSVMDVGGRRLKNPTEFLSSQRYERILDMANSAFDFIIVDTPPLGLFVDAAIASSQVDGVLITIRSGTDTAADVKEITAQLEKANARILGTVLNGIKSGKTNYYYYYSASGKKAKRRTASQSNRYDSSAEEELLK